VLDRGAGRFGWGSPVDRRRQKRHLLLESSQCAGLVGYFLALITS